MEIELTDKQMLQIADMAAELLMAKIDTVQNAHMELFAMTRDFFADNPDLRGKHKELGEIITKLEQSNPGLAPMQLFDMAAREVRRLRAD